MLQGLNELTGVMHFGHLAHNNGHASLHYFDYNYCSWGDWKERDLREFQCTVHSSELFLFK